MRKLLLIFVSFVAPNSYTQHLGEPATSRSAIKIDSAEIVTKQFHPQFKNRYGDNDFVYEVQAQEQTLYDRFLDWLASIVRNLFQLGSTKQSYDIAMLIIKLVAAIIVLTVVYLLVKAILNKEGRWLFARNQKKILHYDVSEQNLQAIDFEKVIKETTESGNLRLAVRYYYLWLLKNLSSKGYIQLDSEKTNSDYLHEIQGQQLKDQFSYLSYLYNYIWYGEFDIDTDTFSKTKKAFETTISTVR